MTDSTTYMRQIQDRLPKAENIEDSTSLIDLFSGSEETSAEDTSDSAIYSAHFMSQFEKMQLSSSPTSSQDALLSAFSGSSSKSEGSVSQPAAPQNAQEEYREVSKEASKRQGLLGTGEAISNTADLSSEIQSESNEKVHQSFLNLDKFRILVIGQAGVGKSTLCGKILGISEDKASSFQVRSTIFLSNGIRRE